MKDLIAQIMVNTATRYGLYRAYAIGLTDPQRKVLIRLIGKYQTHLLTVEKLEELRALAIRSA